MLIHALCEYYDILAKAEKVLVDGYSNVKVHYLVALTEDGHIDDIINYQNEVLYGKGKKKYVPRDVVMPKRTEKPGIDANIIDHRPLYLFGLNLVGEELTPQDKTNKAKKSHEAFIEKNLLFLDGLDSPVINAFRNFLQKWNVNDEIKNEALLGLGKNYGNSSYIFCLSGYPEQLLHEDEQIKRRWETYFQEILADDTKKYIAQCAIEGTEAPIARIHNKIKGIPGGLATGSVLIGFNNLSENSYGNEQSYNSNISETAMKKYTEAFNYLLKDNVHKLLLDDLTIVFWAMNPKEEYENKFMALLMGEANGMDAEQTDTMLKVLMNDAQNGQITMERLQSLDMIQDDVDFYMVGLKPNSSRVAVKFIYRRKYADILWNIAKHQLDLQVSEEMKSIPFWRIKKELISPKNKNEKINPAIVTKLFESIIYGYPYPVSLLETVIRRIKTDTDSKVNRVRAGIVKACINRNYAKGELKVALDKENYGQAYLCGRLFAVLEKLQQDASNNSLNRTIKDAYFASASSKPAMVFPKLIKLGQNHLGKVEYPTFYNKLIGEIMDKLEGEFPNTLLLVEQGKFIVGYYQQYQDFYKKKENVNETEEQGNEN